MEVELTDHGEKTICQTKDPLLSVRMADGGLLQDDEHDLSWM